MLNEVYTKNNLAYTKDVWKIYRGIIRTLKNVYTK